MYSRARETMRAPTADNGRARRVTVALTAHCRIGNGFLRVPVSNLSVSGLLLRTRERAKEGTPVRVALALPDPDGSRICTLVGKVARVAVDPRGLPCGLGVRFHDEQIAPADRASLQRFIAENAPGA